MAFNEQERAQLAETIYGCWMGKNCGGTLGGPLERAWGQAEPFDVWWYPRLQEGGIPNDDLEMQLIWLKALEEVGPQLTSHHLAQYWLTHIMYNPDEYGLCKTNLRLGLLPPVAGNYNNWFKDCMGCPIRTEIWACVAPGHPRIAVRYAYEDSIVDHAGGESIWGAFFNTAVEAAAFVVSDRDQLLEIGLSYVPQGTRTRAAIEAAIDAHREGISDWREARRRVMQAAPHYVAQYAPINIGFQVIGWLYGDDFGDAICKAVNCGYDTDCTGATLGAFLGLLLGRGGLPEKWTAPLGDSIATSERHGGLRHTLEAPNPVPADLTDLTERTLRMAEKVLAYHGVTLRAPGHVDIADLRADESVFTMAEQSPTRISLPSPTIEVAVDYLDTPAVCPGERKRLDVVLTNPHAEALDVTSAWRVPEGWPAVETRRLQIPPRQQVTETFEIIVPDSPRLLNNSNELLLQVQALDRPATPAVPVRLIGSSRWRISNVRPLAGQSDRQAYDAAGEVETPAGDGLTPGARAGAWRDVWAQDNNLPVNWPEGGGTVYAQMFLHAGTAREIWIGLAANCPARVFVNGELSSEQFMYRPIRPNYDGGHERKQETYGPAQVRQGWNEVLIKLVRAADAPPFAAHVVVCEKEWHRGATTLLRTRLPWD